MGHPASRAGTNRAFTRGGISGRPEDPDAPGYQLES